MLKIEKVRLADLVEYEANAKLHPEEQVRRIADSIESFGYNDPIAVDENNVIIEGHGRKAALELLGWEEVEVIRLEGLTDQQRKAYILAHNKLNMETGFDLDLLSAEIESITDFDMGDFGFEIPEIKVVSEEDHQRYKDETFEATYGFENFEKAYYEGVGPYDIPEIAPVYHLPDVREWQGFNYVLSDKEPKGKGVHFFVHDYQFLRCWNNPDKYLDYLKRYEVVLSPDFSPYADMPRAMSIYNHYRKHWLAAYWQEHGINVIPTITWSSRETLDFCFDGEPRGGIVAVSTVGIMGNDTPQEFKDLFYVGWDMMMERLEPRKVLLYGKQPEGIDGANVVNIESFAQKRWGK